MLPRMTFNEKTVVVTGAASGIGRTAARKFAKQGARVACLDIHRDGNEDTVRLIEEEGGKAIAVELDLGEPASIHRAFAGVIDAFGTIDAAALIGGYSWRGETLDITPEQWDRFVNVNLRGAFFCCQEALRVMYAKGKGAIVTMSADGAFFPVEGLAVQAAAKGGVALMSRTLGFEAAKRGVRVNSVSPGIVHVQKTGFVSDPGPALRRVAGEEAPAHSDLPKVTAIGRYMEEEEIADTILYLCSDSASGVNGQTLMINGGGYRTMDY